MAFPKILEMKGLQDLNFEPTKNVCIAKEIKDIISMTQKDSIHEKVDNNSWNDFISIQEINFTLHENLCISPSSKIPYTWEQADNGRIGVYLYYIDSIHVEADENHVKSPKLFGDWWAPVEDIIIKKEESFTKIECRPKNNVHFPVLIRGGESVDPHSMFFLGLLSNSFSKEYFIKWMAMASEMGEPNAQNFLGRVCINDKNYNEAIHWLARSTIEHNIAISVVDLSILLVQTKLNPLLAENLLCGLCKSGNPLAFIELGKIYLNGVDDIIKHDASKALKLLAFASEVFHSQEATEIIEKYHSEHPFGEFDLVDIGISAGIALSIATASYFILKKIIFRNKK